MSQKRKTPFPVHDDIDRALLKAYRAACDLVLIAGAGTHTDDVIRAARALADLGAMAAVPVVTAIEQIPSESRRLMLVELLRDIPPFFGLDVHLSLVRIATNDPSERVRRAAMETSEILRRLSHGRFKRLLALRAGGDPVRAEENGATPE